MEKKCPASNLIFVLGKKLASHLCCKAAVADFFVSLELEQSVVKKEFICTCCLMSSLTSSEETRMSDFLYFH